MMRFICLSNKLKYTVHNSFDGPVVGFLDVVKICSHTTIQRYFIQKIYICELAIARVLYEKGLNQVPVLESVYVAVPLVNIPFNESVLYSWSDLNDNH